MIPESRRKFITLTIPNVEYLSADDLKGLIASFRRLRQRKYFKSVCRGGLYKIEVTNQGKGKGWHPHLHLLADAGFISSFHLSFEWCQVTGGKWIRDKVKADVSGNAVQCSGVLDLAAEGVSPGWSVIAGSGAFGVVVSASPGGGLVVDWKGPREGFRKPKKDDPLLLSEVRSVDVRKARPGSVRELCKYISKSTGIDHDGGLVVQLLGAVKGKRLFEAFGIYYGIKRELKKAAELAFVCPHGFDYEWIWRSGPGRCLSGSAARSAGAKAPRWRRGPASCLLISI